MECEIAAFSSISVLFCHFQMGLEVCECVMQDDGLSPVDFHSRGEGGSCAVDLSCSNSTMLHSAKDKIHTAEV